MYTLQPTTALSHCGGRVNASERTKKKKSDFVE